MVRLRCFRNPLALVVELKTKYKAVVLGMWGKAEVDKCSELYNLDSEGRLDSQAVDADVSGKVNMHLDLAGIPVVTVRKTIVLRFRAVPCVCCNSELRNIARF